MTHVMTRRALIAIIGLTTACSSTTTASTTRLPVDSELAATSATRLVIESWRSADQRFWDEEIIPVFEQANPDIDVIFASSEPAAYDEELTARLDRQLAGDIIACRPHQRARDLFLAGHLAALDPALVAGFDERTRAVWSHPETGVAYCVPGLSVLHGFAYNAAIFDEVGVDVPTTTAEFQSVLAELQADGRYDPLSFGYGENWIAGTLGVFTIGPSYWNDSDGPFGFEAVDAPKGAKDAFSALSSWRDYLPVGADAMTMSGIETHFIAGQGAIMPLGSWQLSLLLQPGAVDFGVFAPPVNNAGDRCAVVEHMDMGFGVNAATTNPEASMRFLRWVASREFAETYAAALPGFFPLLVDDVDYHDASVAQVEQWRHQCDTAGRSGADLPFDFEESVWKASTDVLRGTISAHDAATDVRASYEVVTKP